MEQVVVEYVELQPIIEKLEPRIQMMKKYFNNHGHSYFIVDEHKNIKYKVFYAPKYNSTIFYLTPFYHEIFPHLDRLITLDVDIVFRVDASELYQQFETFDPENVMGIANDLSPHYHTMLIGYESNHPGTKLGSPGPLQGLNVGVVLYRLDRMRKSNTYNSYLEDSSVETLAEKYGFTKTHLGHQDWITLVHWDSPNLIRVLLCQFNRQLSDDYNKGVWVDLFPLYHSCPGKIKVFHANSDKKINVE